MPQAQPEEPARAVRPMRCTWPRRQLDPWRSSCSVPTSAASWPAVLPHLLRFDLNQ